MSVTKSVTWWLKRLVHRKSVGKAHPYGHTVGDKVLESPMGEGVITDIKEDGTVSVNDCAVTWFTRVDGYRFDPTHRHGGTKFAKQSKPVVQPKETELGVTS